MPTSLRYKNANVRMAHADILAQIRIIAPKHIGTIVGRVSLCRKGSSPNVPVLSHQPCEMVASAGDMDGVPDAWDQPGGLMAANDHVSPPLHPLARARRAARAGRRARAQAAKCHPA